MAYKIKTTNHFDKQALSLSLVENPFQGDGLGNGFHKVRMVIKSKGKGKSGGTRVITMVKVINETITLAAIYDKSDMATISDKELKDLL